ncbi:hypothetical protein AB0E10_39150 [Streptomyces sp. NPDC048045]|uniref:hypothetical protein n=1 Tax=unclassified Streptomyces TaxID=2593676 RepID=UPI003428730F
MTKPSMSDQMNALVKAVRNEVPDCVAAGVVDMSTGMLLAVDSLDSHPSEVLDLLAAATFDLFRGRNVFKIEQIFKERRGVLNSSRYFQEILVNSENLVHLFMVSPGNEDLVTVAVARSTVNIGMLFAAARGVLKQFDVK